ncbi:MAG: type II toxin-antitoxin system death-on-curing family toxin [Deltaproteobacteria bacterium]|nr:type II toxin-antitoxin system death-on-curing family toxin [Deltaproteobacteria bacterium]
MKASWRWIDKQALLILHDESLAEHGGASGLRDEGLLDSALVRPLNLASYGTPDAAQLAAAYASGLSQNHAFVDGNKRAAFLALGLLLYLNGYRLTATQAMATATILSLAAGELSEEALADWVRKNSAARAT